MTDGPGPVAASNKLRRIERVPNLKQFLRGAWKIRKSCWDATTGHRMRFDGGAWLTDCAEGLLFEERGTVAFGAYRGEAARSYVFCFYGSHAATVRFSDGRPFHDLDLATGIGHVKHACAPDCYLGRYRLLDPNRWMLSWRVTGPRKRQMLVSRFVRVTC